MVTIYALLDYNSSCFSTSCPEKDTSSRPFHIVMILLGAVAVFLVWFMFIFILCKLNLRYAVGNQARAGYHQPNSIQPFYQQSNGFQMNQMNGMNQQVNVV